MRSESGGVRISTMAIWLFEVSFSISHGKCRRHLKNEDHRFVARWWRRLWPANGLG